MERRQHTCFFVMPFSPELNFFYLYLKLHLERKHALVVERADQSVLTIAMLEKIRRQIQVADVVICDITGNNPNVFYELGHAHAITKPVILLTQDPPEKIPVDLRQFEVICYQLSDEIRLLSKLDNALHNVFLHEFEALYQHAAGLLREFNDQTGSRYEAASKEEFQLRVIGSDSRQQSGASFLLPKILKETTDILVIQRMIAWLDGLSR